MKLLAGLVVGLTATVWAQTQALSNFSLTKASLLKVPAIVDNTTNLVTFALVPGTDACPIAPTFTVAPGQSVNPKSGDQVDLSKPVTYTVSANGNTVASWTFESLQMGSPALPGVYADPNIAVFNGVYYIYTTTDGTPGWGGQTIYAWKSCDLVSWIRTAQPLVTLNGTAGNVPWAIGNAWAPTIMERGGKYYLYFSGNNPTFDRKTIGMAVGDSPDGTFVAEPTAMINNTEKYTAGQVIDPAAFHDPKTGKYFLYWGNGNPLFAELADDMISLKEDTIAPVVGLENFTEASFVVYRAPYYHYTYSKGDTGLANYTVHYATATEATGPWTYRGVVLTQDPKHGILSTGSSGTVKVPGRDEWYIAYHRFRIPGGDGVHRETCIDKVTFDPNTGLMNPVVPTLAGIKPVRRRS